MAGLNLAGPLAVGSKGLMRKSDTETQLGTGVTRSYALARMTTLAAPYALKSYVDSQDATFSSKTYVDAQDAANLALTAKGVPNGVATLDGGSPPKLTLAQAPNLGSGYVKGPYGVTTQISADTTSTTAGDLTIHPVQLAQIDLGTPGIIFKVMAFADVLVGQAANSRAVIEWRIGDSTQVVPFATTAAATLSAGYNAQTVVASGAGRSYYNDFNSVFAEPGGTTIGGAPTAGHSATTHWYLTLWLYSITQGVVTVKNANIVLASAFLQRTAA